MGFLATKFPDVIARGATGGHAHFQTEIVELLSGRESATSLWQFSRGRWNVSQGLKAAKPDGTLAPSARRHEAARDMLYMARGRRHHFRFKDWADHVCHRANGRLVLISGNAYRIAKVYGSEVAHEYVRTLTRPVAGTVQVWIGGVLQVGGYTVDTSSTDFVDGTTGVLTFSSPPGGALEVACEFDVPCRFDVDRVDTTLVHRNGFDGTSFIEWDNIAIVEVRE
jgi:uncharacterized protein (TIGR02217 family)